ncbi:MAG: CheR family methyltransferase [Cyanobacteriota bacterium]|nr:CheR family methyltransferase [Cyanobacteriota bacterium]
MKVSGFAPYNYYNQCQNISFGTTARRYKLPSGEEFGNDSWLFRDDMDWEKLSLYEKKNSEDKPKVNIVQFAASDGSEAYTQIMSILENNPRPDDNKFFPIMAYDIDSEITKSAQSGYINTLPFDRLNLQMNVGDYDKYFSQGKGFLNIKNDKNLNSVNTSWYSSRNKQNGGIKALKANKILTDKVKFHNDDMYRILGQLRDNSNTILMCRNVIGYFDERQAELFAKLVSFKLKSGSLFLIGEHDTRHTNIDKYLHENNFMHVMKNVYKKL